MSSTCSSVDDHRNLYRRLSAIDKRLYDANVRSDRRLAFWKRLDFTAAEQYLDPATAASVLDDFELSRSLRERAFSQLDSWSASSIYEALVAFFFLTVETDDFVFRGHLDASWDLVPSFYRLDPPANPMIHAHVIYGAYRWAERRIGQQLVLTPIQAEAAAQHYGSGTTLLDFSESLRVAAFFATTPLHASHRPGDEGSLYAVTVTDLKKLNRAIIRGKDMPKALARIHATKGVFIPGWPYPQDSSGPFVQSRADIID